MLTEGYLRGWLDFRYPYPWSRIREEQILLHLEKDLYVSLLGPRIQVEASLVSRNPTSSNVGSLMKQQSKLLELKLPYVAQQSSMDGKKPPSKTEIAEVKAMLAARGKAFDAELKAQKDKADGIF